MITDILLHINLYLNMQKKNEMCDLIANQNANFHTLEIN